MKIKILNYICSGIIVFNLWSCENKSKTQSEFLYSNKDKIVEMKLENEAKFLVAGKSTIVSFKIKNINSQKFMVVAPGSVMIRAEKNSFLFMITPIKETLVDGKLEIHVTELVANGKNFAHTFSVPVKLKAE